VALACGCLLLLGAVLSHNTSLAYTRFTVVTPTPNLSTVLITTPEVKPTPTVIIVSQPSSYLDPLAIISMIALVVQAITLFLVYRYVRDTAAMAKATRDSADATRDSAKAAENTLQEMRNARAEENAPFVVVYFKYVHSRSTIYLVVENIGKSVAQNIKMEFDPPLQGSKFMRPDLKSNTLLTEGIYSIVPNYKIPIPFDFLNHYIHENLPLEYSVSVTYYGNGNLPKQEVKYVLDLKPYKYTHFVTEKGLDEIDETLQRLESHFSHYEGSIDTANNLLNHIANAINRGLIIKNRIDVSHNNVDASTVLKEFIYLWVVAYGKQQEKWNKPFIFGLRAKCFLFSEELTKSAITLDLQAWSEKLKQVISNLSTLSNMQLGLDRPDGFFPSAPIFLSLGSSKDDFDSLGDSIIADIRIIIDLIEKENKAPLNGDNKDVQLPTSVEESD